MRTIKLSRTFHAELATLLKQGLPKFGGRVIADKQASIFHTVENFLVHHASAR